MGDLTPACRGRPILRRRTGPQVPLSGKSSAHIGITVPFAPGFFHSLGSLRALEAVMTDFLRAFWEDARRVVNLIGEGWLLTQANHFFCQHSTAMSG
jgi:hypothetical protein